MCVCVVLTCSLTFQISPEDSVATYENVSFIFKSNSENFVNIC